MGKSFKRKAIKAHEEFLKDPQYRGKVEKHIKVRKREQQEQEAEEAIQEAAKDYYYTRAEFSD